MKQITVWDISEIFNTIFINKKYVLWNAGSIAEIVRNTTFDDDIKTHYRL